jgi:AbrB family looped-hinge helix DNA binding protein
MTTATVNSDGRITIPATVRRALRVKAGDRVELVEIDPGRFELFAVKRSVKELRGMFGNPSTTVSIEEMNRTIARRGAPAR